MYEEQESDALESRQLVLEIVQSRGKLCSDDVGGAARWAPSPESKNVLLWGIG